MTPVECDCPTCRRMCASSTCLPTPAQALGLIERGFAGQLATYAFEPDPKSLRCVGPAPRGQEGARNLPHTRAGPCTFHVNGGCELHGIAKPLEGQLAQHDRPWLPIRLHIMASWTREEFDGVVAALNSKSSMRNDKRNALLKAADATTE